MLNPYLNRSRLSRSGRRILNATPKKMEESRTDEATYDDAQLVADELTAYVARFLKMSPDRRSKGNEVMTYPIPGTKYTIKFWCNPEAKGYTGTQNCLMHLEPEPTRQEKFIKSWSLSSDINILKKKIKAFYDALLDYVEGMINENISDIRDQIREGVIEVKGKLYEMGDYNPELRTLSFKGDKNIDKAHEIWHNKLTPLERVTLSNEVKKSLRTNDIRQIYRAALNYIADNLSQFESVKEAAEYTGKFGSYDYNERGMKQALRDAERKFRGRDRGDKVLDYINATFEGFGVEAIRNPNEYDRYYGDTVGLYVNFGDTYDLTVVYDTMEDEFHVMSYGDWIEMKERGGMTFESAKSIKEWTYSSQVTMDRNTARKINNQLGKLGLDGNGRFRTPIRGFSVANEVLTKFGYHLEMLTNHEMSMHHDHPEGRDTISIIKTSDDPYTEGAIVKNRMLVFTWHDLGNISRPSDRGNMYECLAYVS